MPTASPPLLAAELLPANGNRGAELLQPGAMEGVRLYLDALQRLGARGVNLSIVFPLFGEQEPRREEYVAFYREVVAECRRRGLTVGVEMGPAFAGTPYSTLSVDYSAFTPQSYLDARLRQAALAAHALEPDYLTLAEEQDTERMLTGLDLTVDDYVAMLRRARAVIDPPPGVLLGAGSGSWEPPDLIDGILSETDLDFVNIHLYPLTNGAVNYVDRVAEWATRARAARKRVMIGETWLYKASVQELRSGLPYDQVFARDVFSFWAPLDALHIETVHALARATGIEYVSFFWSKFFFAYLDYGASPAAAGADLMRLSNAAAVQAIVERRLTASGEAFRRAAGGAE
ncbi:MAG TPA: hypothetical protein VNN12_05340 [Dehalococcoidia bacterium]|jgi:hypothetical protein|nr:hypothetical protein [Dehalococcoidia bacterium]